MYTAYIYLFITDIYIFHTSEHDPNNPPSPQIKFPSRFAPSHRSKLIQDIPSGASGANFISGGWD